MRIILLRHGVAEDFELGAAKNDAERALTAQGKNQVARVASALRRYAGDADLVATSPYLRAAQTAEILRSVYAEPDRPPLQRVDALGSGTSVEIMTEWLAANDPDCTLVAVGHEPDVSLLTGYLTTADASRYASFVPAAAALVECRSTPARGNASLRWFLAPDILGDQCRTVDE